MYGGGGYPQKHYAVATAKEEGGVRYGLPARLFSVLYILVLMLTPVCALVGPWREGRYKDCSASLVRSECFGARRHLHEWGDAVWPTGRQTTVAVVGLIVVVLDSVVRVTASLACIACGHPDVGVSPWAAFCSSLLGFVAVVVVAVGWKLEDGASDSWGFYCCLAQAILDLLIGIVLLCLRFCRKRKPKAPPPPPPPPP
eukprot:Rhum_TRINITY_DN14941_c0_g1::Rhum_TRINITY_DN14941_c0_g1_i1::g.127018::m.127018